MNVAKFSLHMLRKEKGKSLFYTFSSTFTVMVVFIFLNIIDNTYYQGVDVIYAGNYNKIFSTMLSFAVLAVIVGMSFYAYNFYLNSQTKEIGIYLLGGSRMGKIFFYLFVQNMVIYSVSLIIGIILGFVFVPIVNMFINYTVGIDYPIFVYSPWAFGGTIVMTIMMLVYLAIVATGFIHRHEIKDLMGMTREIAKKDERIIAVPNSIYTFFMILPFYLYIINSNPQLISITVCVGLLIGFVGFCRYVIPRIIEKIQRKFLIDKKIELISSAHLHHLIVQTCASLQLFLFIVIFMNTCVVSNIDSPINLALIEVSYVFLVVSVIMCIYYKVLLDGGSHKQTFKHLFKMGYKKEEIKKMIQQEIFMIYFFTFIICFIHVGMFYYGCINQGLINANWAIINIVIFTVAIVIAGISNYFTYKKEMVKEIR